MAEEAGLFAELGRTYALEIVRVRQTFARFAFHANWIAIAIMTLWLALSTARHWFYLAFGNLFLVR